jgi:hypothetical protein
MLKPFKNANHIIRYLGRYSHKVAISNERIVGIEGEKVIFKWRDYKNQALIKTMKLDGSEFIRRFLLHVLPKGFCKIRYFGIFAFRTRKCLLVKCREIMGKVVGISKFEGLSWQKALFLLVALMPTYALFVNLVK